MSNDEEFEKCINNLIAAAIAELRAFTDRLDYSKPYECKQATLEFMRYLHQKYKAAAQEVAMLEYSAMRGEQNDNFTPKPYDGMSEKTFMSGVDYYCKFLFGERVEDEDV